MQIEVPWVLIRADGDQEIGSGHIMRCLALAEAFSRRGYAPIFACQSCSRLLADEIRSRGFGLHRLALPEKNLTHFQAIDAQETINFVTRRDVPPAWVVVDHYDLDYVWERVIGSTGIPLLALDDADGRKHDCDVLLNQTMEEEEGHYYDSLLFGKTRLLLGRSYLLLRSEVAACINERRSNLEAGTARDVVVFLGATDNDDLTLKIALRLAKCVSPDDLLVLIGHMNSDHARIARWCQNSGVRFRNGLQNMSEIFKSTEILVGACGMTAVEAQAVSIPCVFFPLTNTQREVAQKFARAYKAVVLDPEDLDNSESLCSAMTRVRRITNGSAHENLPPVHGADNVVSALVGASDE